MYCIVLYCIVLYCIVLYCIVLYWIGLDWIGLDWIGLDWIGLDWIGLDWIVIYDSLGLIAPITARIKTIFQILCKDKLNWDDIIPPNIALVWNKFLE